MKINQIRYIKYQIKNYTGAIKYLVAIFLLTLAVFAIFTLGIKSNSELNKLKTAIRTETNADRGTLPFLLSNLDSLGGLFQIEFVEDREKALELLRQKKLDILVDVPKNIVENIKDAENRPMQIYFENSYGLEKKLIKSLIESGNRMISSAQAIIYEWYKLLEEGKLMAGNQVDKDFQLKGQEDLNKSTISMILARRKMIESRNTSNRGLKVSFMEEAIIGFSLSVILILGIGFFSKVNEEKHLEMSIYKRVGINNPLRFFARQVSIFISLMIFLFGVLSFYQLVLKNLIPDLKYDIFKFDSLENFFCSSFNLLIMVTLFSVLINFLLGFLKSSSTLIFYILACLTIAFLSSWLIPWDFLPETIHKVASFTKLVDMQNYVYGMMEGDLYLEKLLTHLAIFGLLGTIAYRIEVRNEY